MLAFFFGYLLTSLPLLRSGLSVREVVPIALAADTISITIMELVDNGVLLVYPGAMDAGLGDVLFWWTLGLALAVAWVITFPANRWLISRGRGHAVVHATARTDPGGLHESLITGPFRYQEPGCPSSHRERAAIHGSAPRIPCCMLVLWLCRLGERSV